MTLFRRILIEKRAIITVLAIGVAANVGLYALVVYPRRVKSEGAVDRAQAAARTVRAAERDVSAARALVDSKTRAEQELSTFFDKVLPNNQTAAVTMTYAPLPAIASKANVRVAQRRYDVDAALSKTSRVGRLQIHMTLQGDYASLRRFIYAVESAPEFVIIDNVTLAQSDPNKPLTLSMELSAYYTVGRNAT
jgi:Type II secretion system (T2SS), protein M subtype b